MSIVILVYGKKFSQDFLEDLLLVHFYLIYINAILLHFYLIYINAILFFLLMRHFLLILQITPHFILFKKATSVTILFLRKSLCIYRKFYGFKSRKILLQDFWFE